MDQELQSNNACDGNAETPLDLVEDTRACNSQDADAEHEHKLYLLGLRQD